MSAVIVNVGRIDSHTIIVEFSDESFVTFTIAELASAKRFREMPDPEISPDLMN
jgi:hypothetical protein